MKIIPSSKQAVSVLCCVSGTRGSRCCRELRFDGLSPSPSFCSASSFFTFRSIYGASTNSLSQMRSITQRLNHRNSTSSVALVPIPPSAHASSPRHLSPRPAAGSLMPAPTFHPLSFLSSNHGPHPSSCATTHPASQPVAGTATAPKRSTVNSNTRL